MEELKKRVYTLQRKNKEGYWYDIGDYVCFDFIEGFLSIESNVAAMSGDRVIYNSKVFIISENTNTTLKLNEDEIESSLLAFERAGVEVEDGEFLENEGLVGEEDRFVSAWIGTWAKNIARNYNNIIKGETITIIKDKCKDVPVIIVGAGPSLDKNIDQLKNIEAVIIAVDKSYKMLLARNIVPDLVVSIDCHDDLIPDYISGTDSYDHVLVANTAQSYKISKVWKGRILWYNMRHSGIQFIEQVLPSVFPGMPGIANAGCVINTAIILSHYLGTKKIILVGCDFSYPDNKVCSKLYDCVDGKMVERKFDYARAFDDRTFKIKEGGIYTYPPYLKYRQSLLQLIKVLGLETINATEGGIVEGPGIVKMSLIDTKNIHCSNIEEKVTKAKKLLRLK